MQAIQAQTAELRSAVEALKQAVKGMETARANPPPAQRGLTVEDLRAELRAFAAKSPSECVSMSLHVYPA